MRVVRICFALAGTVVAGLVGLAAVLVGAGRHLEDACITEPPASFAPESTVLRGPVRIGLVTYRCEVEGGPGASYVFTDGAPLVWALVVGTAVVATTALLWLWATHRRTPGRQTAPA